MPSFRRSSKIKKDDQSSVSSRDDTTTNRRRLSLRKTVSQKFGKKTGLGRHNDDDDDTSVKSGGSLRSIGSAARKRLHIPKTHLPKLHRRKNKDQSQDYYDYEHFEDDESLDGPGSADGLIQGDEGPRHLYKQLSDIAEVDGVPRDEADFTADFPSTSVRPAAPAVLPKAGVVAATAREEKTPTRSAEGNVDANSSSNQTSTVPKKSRTISFQSNTEGGRGDRASPQRRIGSLAKAGPSALRRRLKIMDEHPIQATTVDLPDYDGGNAINKSNTLRARLDRFLLTIVDEIKRDISLRWYRFDFRLTVLPFVFLAYLFSNWNFLRITPFLVIIRILHYLSTWVEHLVSSSYGRAFEYFKNYLYGYYVAAIQPIPPDTTPGEYTSAQLVVILFLKNFFVKYYTDIQKNSHKRQKAANQLLVERYHERACLDKFTPKICGGCYSDGPYRHAELSGSFSSGGKVNNY